MKLNSLIVISRKQNRNGCCLVSDHTHHVSVKRDDQDRADKGNVVYSQLAGKALVHDLCIGTGVEDGLHFEKFGRES